MDAAAANERLIEIQSDTTTDGVFASMQLTQLLRDTCTQYRATGVLLRADYEPVVAGVAAVCGLGPHGPDVLWEWCCDIAADFALEPDDPWADGSAQT